MAAVQVKTWNSIWARGYEKNSTMFWVHGSKYRLIKYLVKLKQQRPWIPLLQFLLKFSMVIIRSGFVTWFPKPDKQKIIMSRCVYLSMKCQNMFLSWLYNFWKAHQVAWGGSIGLQAINEYPKQRYKCHLPIMAIRSLVHFAVKLKIRQTWDESNTKRWPPTEVRHNNFFLLTR